MKLYLKSRLPLLVLVLLLGVLTTGSVAIAKPATAIKAAPVFKSHSEAGGGCPHEMMQFSPDREAPMASRVMN